MLLLPFSFDRYLSWPWNDFVIPSAPPNHFLFAIYFNQSHVLDDNNHFDYWCDHRTGLIIFLPTSSFSHYNINFDLPRIRFLDISESFQLKWEPPDSNSRKKWCQWLFKRSRKPGLQLAVMFIRIGADRIAIRMKHRNDAAIARSLLVLFHFVFALLHFFPASHSLSCVHNMFVFFLSVGRLVGSIAYIKVHSHLCGEYTHAIQTKK